MAEHGAAEVPRGPVGWMCIYSTSYSMETRQKQVKDCHIGDLVKSCTFLRPLLLLFLSFGGSTVATVKICLVSMTASWRTPPSSQSWRK